MDYAHHRLEKNKYVELGREQSVDQNIILTDTTDH